MTRAEEAKIIYEQATYLEPGVSYGRIDEEGRLHLCPMGVRLVVRGYEPILSAGGGVQFHQDIFKWDHPGLWDSLFDLFGCGSEVDPDVAPGDQDWEEASDEYFAQMEREKGKFLKRLKRHWTADKRSTK